MSRQAFENIFFLSATRLKIEEKLVVVIYYILHSLPCVLAPQVFFLEGEQRQDSNYVKAS